MNEVEWLSIGPTAEKFGIEIPRLRTWCDRGLIEVDKRSTGRWIPSTEFPKIEKIKEIFDRGGNVTYEDVKEELIKSNLYKQYKDNEEEEKKVQEMAELMEKAFEKSGAGEFFMSIASEFAALRSEISSLTKLVEHQSHQQGQYLLEDKTRMDKLEEDNKALKGLVQQFISSDKELKESFTNYMKERELEKEKHAELEAKLSSIETKINDKPEKKGLFSRIFG
ncbi:hypothetical protein [Neobacillus mesonae]|uniref:hypothetical protein n=1 Tax=Neobacillus mesonae TaxID=1193713 RepID=UPI00203AC781|nr:hypothetical protein [Neobacillus mesonae]MCM3569835.1 hypothetical protein [Neobacillus mesonae]